MYTIFSILFLFQQTKWKNQSDLIMYVLGVISLCLGGALMVKLNLRLGDINWHILIIYNKRLNNSTRASIKWRVVQNCIWKNANNVNHFRHILDIYGAQLRLKHDIKTKHAQFAIIPNLYISPYVYCIDGSRGEAGWGVGHPPPFPWDMNFLKNFNVYLQAIFPTYNLNTTIVLNKIV